MSASKKKKKKGRIIIFVIEIVLLLAVLAVLFVWSKYQKLNHEPDIIGTEDLINTELDETAQEVLEGYTNVAVFGLDNRSNGEYSAGNSDVIMIASINNETKEVKLVSIYRDTYLNVADDGSYDFHKANYAYNKGGVEMALKMLNHNLDLDITDYVVIDFNAVVEAIDLLGGVEIEIDDKEAKWMDFYINETAAITNHDANSITEAGVYNMDGVQATSYCRIRFTTGDDFKRTQRQREVLSKMVDKAKKAGLITINKILDSVLDDISTNFSPMELASLASQMFNYELVDTTGFPFKLCNIPSMDYIVAPCDLATNVTELHEYLFNEYQYQPTNTVQSYSAQIEAETGKGVGDEEIIEVEPDNYTNKSQSQDTADTQTQDVQDTSQDTGGVQSQDTAGVQNTGGADTQGVSGTQNTGGTDTQGVSGTQTQNTGGMESQDTAGVQNTGGADTQGAAGTQGIQ